MIKKKLPVLQDYSYKKTSIQLFNEYMLSYSWENETCPWCGSKGNCVSHDTYTRSMTDFAHGKTVYGQVCVLRLRCTGCGHIHAILYRWRDLFVSQKREWLGALVSAETTPSAFIKGICLPVQYSASFACRFVLLSARSFLQSHANPANYRQKFF